MAALTPAVIQNTSTDLDVLFSDVTPDSRPRQPCSHEVLTVENDKLAGCVNSVLLRPGLKVIFSEIEFRSEAAWFHRGDNTTKLHFRLGGATKVQFSDGTRAAVDISTASFLNHPADIEKVQVWNAGQTEKAITFVFFSDFDGDLLLNSLPSTNTWLGVNTDFFQPRLVVHSLAMPFEMREVAGALWAQRSFTDGRRRLLLEAKALELLYLCTNDAFPPNCGACHITLTQRDLRLLEKARQVIEEDVSGEIKIASLARQLGINQTKLNRGFKTQFGMTPFQFRLSCRMKRAKELLLTTELPIIDVAAEVGYEHPCNFATAFRRFYGYQPKQVRTHNASCPLTVHT